MSGWRRCDTCRKVRTGTEFDGEATTCQLCRTGPTATVRKKAAAVTRTRSSPRVAAPGPRRPLLGAVGRGDLEVRERRARRTAKKELAESHPEQFGLLLRDARQAEGLRPLNSSKPPLAADGGE